MPKRSAFFYFHFLVVGYAISSLGTFLNMVALNLFAFSLTGSALQTGVFMALRLGASFVTGLVAGGLVARLNRKRLMIACDSAQALALLALVLAPPAWQGQLLYGFSILFGTCSTLWGVALRTSVPEIVGPDARVRANGLLVTGRSFAMVVGFASAGLVVAWSGYELAFLIDAATFLISALNLAWLPLAAGGPAAGERPANGLAAALNTYRAALVFLRATPAILVLLLIRTIDAFGSASHNVGLPVYASLVRPDNPSSFVGNFWAAWAIGSLLAYQVLARLLQRGGGGRDVGEVAFAIGTCLMSTFFILVFTGLPLPLFLVVAVAAGLADGFTEIAYTSRLQAVPDEQRGFVFGFSAMAESSGLGVGMILSALLMEYLAPSLVVGLAHGLAIALAALFLVLLLSRPRQLAGAERTPQS